MYLRGFCILYWLICLFVDSLVVSHSIRVFVDARFKLVYVDHTSVDRVSSSSENVQRITSAFFGIIIVSRSTQTHATQKKHNYYAVLCTEL